MCRHLGPSWAGPLPPLSARPHHRPPPPPLPFLSFRLLRASTTATTGGAVAESPGQPIGASSQEPAPSVDLSSSSRSCMISKLTAVQNRDDMDSLLGEMVRLKVPALEQSLNELVHSLRSKNQFDEALLVMQHATSAKLKLSLSACNGLLHGVV
nr:unnamed protein product [Digitaria exilis]